MTEQITSNRNSSKNVTEASNHGFLNMFSGRVLVDSITRLNPRTLLSNPVMLIVELTFFIVAAMAILSSRILSSRQLIREVILCRDRSRTFY